MILPDYTNVLVGIGAAAIVSIPLFIARISYFWVRRFVRAHLTGSQSGSFIKDSLEQELKQLLTLMSKASQASQNLSSSLSDGCASAEKIILTRAAYLTGADDMHQHHREWSKEFQAQHETTVRRSEAKAARLSWAQGFFFLVLGAFVGQITWWWPLLKIHM
jgi:hypothetical protein